MNERKPLSKKTRFEVFKRDSFTCQYCGQKAPDVILEVDHIKPVAEGGTNDMLNLVTACFDCNRGKGKRELSDSTSITLRQNQLEQLQERREQLEMLYEWQRGLLDQDADKFNLCCDLIREITDAELNEHGEKCLKKWLAEFDFSIVLEAIRVSFNQYGFDTDDEWNYAFNKIPGICFNKTHKTCTQCVHNKEYDKREHLAKCEFDFDGGYWCKNNYAEHCDRYEPWHGGQNA